MRERQKKNLETKIYNIKTRYAEIDKKIKQLEKEKERLKENYQENQSKLEALEQGLTIPTREQITEKELEEATRSLTQSNHFGRLLRQ